MKTFLLLYSIFLSLSAFTQDSTRTYRPIAISVSPAPLLLRENIGLEIGISKRMTVGIFYTHYRFSSVLFHLVNNASSGSIHGNRLQVFSRFYKGEKLNSFYLQAAVIAGNYSESNFYSRKDTFIFVTRAFPYKSIGASIKLGHSWLTGKEKHFLLDLNIGLQSCSRNAPESTEIGGHTYYREHLKLTSQPVTDGRVMVCSNFMLGWKF